MSSMKACVSWWVIACFLIQLFNISVALPLPELQDDDTFKQLSLGDLQLREDPLDLFSNFDLSRETSLPLSDVQPTSVSSKRSRQRRSSVVNAFADSAIHFDGEVLALSVSGTDMQSRSLADLPSLLNLKRANHNDIDDVDNTEDSNQTPLVTSPVSSALTQKQSSKAANTLPPVEPLSKDPNPSIKTGVESKISKPARVFRLKHPVDKILQSGSTNFPLMVTKKRRFVPKSTFKAHVRHAGRKLETLFLSIFDKSLPKNETAQPTPKVYRSSEWRSAVLSYLLNLKAKGQKIEDADLNEGEMLAQQAVQPEVSPNVVCKVSPYRVCFQMNEHGKLRPLRKAHQLMNVMRVY